MGMVSGRKIFPRVNMYNMFHSVGKAGSWRGLRYSLKENCNFNLKRGKVKRETSVGSSIRDTKENFIKGSSTE